MRGLLNRLRAWWEKFWHRAQRWEIATTPDSADPEHLAPVQRLVERQLAFGLRAVGFAVGERSIDSAVVAFRIAHTQVRVWVGYEMAGIEAPDREARFETQGFLTPESFAAAVVNDAVTQAREQIGLPPQHSSTSFVVFVLIAALLAAVLVYW